MTPLEIIDNFKRNLDIWAIFELTENGFSDEQIIQMMIEYATLCCKAQTQACVENVNPVAESWEELRDSILNTPITLL